jgi:type II secretory pathway component PulK
MKAQRCSGFVSIVALGLLVLVSAMLGSIAMLSHADSQRTRREVRDVQVRQLLFAGMSQARASLIPDLNPKEIVAELPDELKSNGGRLQIVAAQISDRQATFDVTARFEDATATQVVRFEHVDGIWTLKAGVLQ